MTPAEKRLMTSRLPFMHKPEPYGLPSYGPKQGLQRRPPTPLPDCRIMAQASNYRSSWDQRPTILTICSNPGFVAQTCWGRACTEGPRPPVPALGLTPLGSTGEGLA